MTPVEKKFSVNLYKMKHKLFPSDMSCVYDSLIQHAQLTGNLTIATVYDFKLKPSKTYTHLFLSLRHTHTHARAHTHTHTHSLTQEQETFSSTSHWWRFFFLCFSFKNPSALFLSPTNFRKPSPSDGGSTRLAAETLPKLGCRLASVSHSTRHAPDHKYKLMILQIHVYTYIQIEAAPQTLWGSLRIYNA